MREEGVHETEPGSRGSTGRVDQACVLVGDQGASRTGITQGDAASTVEINLALALQALGNTKVDFATVWGQGHTMAERTGDGTANFIAWVKEASA